MKIFNKNINYIQQNFFFAFLVIMFTYMARLIFITDPLITGDEAHYYVWSKHLPFGFYDHGPGIGFFLKFFMFFFGENSFGIRVGGIISMILVSLYMFYFCKRHFGKQAAYITVFLFNSIPLYQAITFTATIDTPLIFFLITALMLYYDGIYTNKIYFIPAGLFLGFALLSKVAAGLVILPFCLYILLIQHKVFRIKEFYISIILALLVYSPFIIFNLQSNFAAIHFMTVRIPSTGNIKQTLLFWLSQLVLMNPVFFILYIFLIPSVFFRSIIQKNKSLLYFTFVSLFTFIYFIRLSLNRHLELNWAMSMYLGGVFIVGFFFNKFWHKKIIRILFNTQIACCLILTIILMGQYYQKWIPIKGDPTNRYYRFRVFNEEFKEYYHSQMDPEIPIFWFNYDIPSLVNFYIKPKKEAIGLNWHIKPTSSFEFIYNDKKLLGKDLYFLSTQTYHADNISINFESYEYITNFTSYRDSKVVGEFYLFKMNKLHTLQTETQLTNNWLWNHFTKQR